MDSRPIFSMKVSLNNDHEHYFSDEIYDFEDIVSKFFDRYYSENLNNHMLTKCIIESAYLSKIISNFEESNLFKVCGSDGIIQIEIWKVEKE